MILQPESHPCDQCGCFDAVQAGDRWLCPDCYAACGSCCAGEFLKGSSANPPVEAVDVPPIQPYSTQAQS